MKNTIKKTNNNDIKKSLKNDDPAFFEGLYSEYFEKLCVYLLNFTSDRELIHDIVQDSFLYLWNNRKKIIITTSIKSYLYRMVYNQLMEHFRKNNKYNSLLQSYHKTFVDEYENLNNTERDARINNLDKCIDQLPKRCKIVFSNKKIDGLKNKQIAENLNISIKTVEAHVTKAYYLLKKCLEVTTNKNTP